MSQIVQSLWIGDSLGLLQRISVASFLDAGDEYHLYTYGRVDGIPSGVVVRDGNEILPASGIFTYRRGPGRGSVSAFSNLFRYQLLLDRGGWWVDTDVVCLRPFSFPGALVLASVTGRSRPSIASGILKLPAGHSLAACCLDRARKRRRRSLKWGEIGPDLLTLVVEELGLEEFVEAPEVFNPVPWWEWERFLSPEPDACAGYVTPASRSVHLYHEMWRRAGLDREREFPAESYVGRLSLRHLRP